MPYANNAGVRIRYKVEGEGPPLVLHHGFAGFLEFFHDTGFVDALREDYQLILLDARGCGASDKPHEREAYRLALRVADVVAVLDDLGLSRAHFYGYSMGGYIGWGIARYAPERFLSLIIGGAGPNEEIVDETDSSPNSTQELLRQGLDAWAAVIEKAFGGWWQPGWKARLLASDVKALVPMAARGEGFDYAAVLSTMTVPCLVFIGENDAGYHKAQKASAFLPNATFVSLPGLDHIRAWQLNVVLPHIRTFLAGVSKA